MGKRDLAFLTVLYATAGRLDEILSIKICHIYLDSKNPYINLLGKGSKTRTAYLLPRAAAHAKAYLKVFHGEKPDPEAYLFYSVLVENMKSLQNRRLISALKNMPHPPMKNARACRLMSMPTGSVMQKPHTGWKMA